MTDPHQAQPGQNDTPAPPPYPTYQQPAAPYQPTAPYSPNPYAQQGGPAAPPGAYGVPVGGYQAPIGGYAVPPAAPAPSRLTGALAMIAGLLASLVIPIVGGIFAFQIGEGVPVDQVLTDNGDVFLPALAPVRDLVLGAEIVFWIGTLLGIAAIVFGIIAIAKNRGRGMGITALVLAVVGSVGFFFVFGLLWAFGSAAGMV